MKIPGTIQEIARARNGMVSTAEAVAVGCSRASLSLWVRAGLLERVAHGVYLLPDAMEDELAVMAARSKRIVFSHETALLLNGLAERTPVRHSATFPRNAVPRRELRDTIACHYVSPGNLSLGKTVRTTSFGAPVPCYDAERTVCDIVRSRNKMDEETFLSGLRLYAAWPAKDTALLDSYARALGAENAVRRYMETLL